MRATLPLRNDAAPVLSPPALLAGKERPPSPCGPGVAHKLETKRFKEGGENGLAPTDPRMRACPAVINAKRPKVKGHINRDLDQHHDQDWQRHSEAAQGQDYDQDGKCCQAVDWLKRIERFDRHHRGAKCAKARIASHVTVPALRLEESGEPAAALSQESGKRFGRIGARLCRTDYPHRPTKAVINRVAVKPVDQLIILN